MIVGFGTHWTNALQRIDAVFGEGFTLEPHVAVRADGRLDGNARPVVDPSRPVSTFRATYRDAGSKQHAKGRSLADSTTRAFSADAPHLRLTIPGEGFDRPRIGDQVVRIATGERFRVASVLDRDRGGLQIALSTSGIVRSGP